jgi:Cof subfamily protein (haloacid dehalogenase superfamily)
VKPEDALVLPDFSRRPDAVAIDIDGTLLDDKSKLSQRNSQAIQKCLTKGIPIIIATSRPARSVRRLVGMGIMNACSLVMQNGAIGIGQEPFSGRIKETIPHQILPDLMASIFTMEPRMRVTIELEGESFGTNNPRDPISLWEINSATPDMQLTLEEALKGEPTKVFIGYPDREISYVANAILKRFSDAISIVGEAGKPFFSIINKAASKSNTLSRLLASQNMTLENVVALGDDLPDYDMLAACGIPIAMGNAVPGIKAICKYRTTSNNDDGVALVLEKILDKR